MHRDLKPENILISDAGQVKVLDFGIAKRFERREGASMGQATRMPNVENDKNAQVWNADGTGDPVILRMPTGHGFVSSVAFSPDSKHIVAACGDHIVRIWNADGSGEPLELRGHEQWVYSVAYSPDGRQIVSGSLDETARIWNTDGSGEPLVFHGHKGSINSVGFSPDGRHILTASSDETTRVWNADGTGAPLVLAGFWAAWSPDGQRIATATKDRTVKIWRSDGAGEPVVLNGHNDSILSIGWSPDSRRIVTGSMDGTGRVWADIESLNRVDDPRLWKATRYCMPIERITQLLNVPESAAQTRRDACMRRVDEAFR